MRNERRDIVVSILGAALFVTIFFSGCSWPGESDARKAFQEKHPNYTVISAKAVEGDSTSIYYQIRFKKPDGEKEYVENWTFLYRENTQSWEVMGIEKVD